jgi:O-antigen ligase
LRYYAPRDFAMFELVFVPQFRWMTFVLVCIWCVALIFLTFHRNDLWLIGLLLIAIFAYVTNYKRAAWDPSAITLLIAVVVGKGIPLLQCRKLTIVCLIALLAIASFWHIESTSGYYHNPRWMGLWEDPNVYGMLMGSGFMLSLCLMFKQHQSSRLRFILYLAAGMMGLGLLFSYSRGSWLGVVISVLYLGKMKGWKFNWRFILLGIYAVAAIVWLFWNYDTEHWYLKRLDLSRPSSQNRVAAWKGAAQIIRDHPFGVGWNEAIQIYGEHYSPPQNGAGAITTNSYLMMGVQLGFPALLCYGVYLWNSFKPKITDSIQIACRAGALVLLVAFWFDGGMFELPTATLFWILLELGSIGNRKICEPHEND